MTVVGEIAEAVAQLFVEGCAELIHRRFGMLGCLVAIGAVCSLVALLVWLVSA